MYGRAESNNKIQTGELALLYFFDEAKPVDWTSLLVERFLYQAKRPKGALVIGGFITRIAERLGVFDCNKTNLKIADGWPTKLDVAYLISMHMLCRDTKGSLVPVHSKHSSSQSEEKVDTPLMPLEKQVAGLKEGQTRMEQQLADISASLAIYFSHHAP